MTPTHATRDTREAALVRIPVAPTDFVVEVGGGHQPFHRSDLIIDKFPFDLEHRSLPLVHAAPVIIADAVRMPLPDKGCDLLFASHIVEHLDDPGAFLAEARRCARRVYIEVPSVRRELMFAWGFHAWLVELRDHHLVFYRNDIPQLFGDFFHRHYDVVLDAWCLDRHSLLNSSLCSDTADLSWEIAPQGALAHLLGASAKGPDRVNFADTAPVDYDRMRLLKAAAAGLLPEPARRRLQALVRRRRPGRARPLTQRIVDRLICQRCRARRLRLAGDTVRCEGCGAAYGQQRGIFDFAG